MLKKIECIIFDDLTEATNELKDKGYFYTYPILLKDKDCRLGVSVKIEDLSQFINESNKRRRKEKD